VTVHVLFVTDPACADSWGAEPWRRRLLVEFGDQVSITYVMAGIGRSFEAPLEQLRAWLDVTARTGMPADPRMWLDEPPRSSHPACLAVKAAAEQGRAGAYLRRLREAFAVEGRRADNADALVALAGDAGLDVARFRVDLRSNAIVEALGADLERAAGRPVPRWEVGGAAVDDVRAAVAGAGAVAQPLPGVEAALGRFGRMAAPEVAAVCDLPGPRAHAELWRLALEWRVRPPEGVSGLWTAA
jgi:putative protein-disulfide isomerase